MTRGWAGRRRLLFAAGAAATLLLGCGDDQPGAAGDRGGDQTAEASTTTTIYTAAPDAAVAFVAAVRAGPGSPALERFDDDELTAQGEVFCDTLARSGSALEAAGELQAAFGTNAGHTALIDSARTHLCPELQGALPGG